MSCCHGDRLQCSHCLRLGDVTTVNLTKIEGGVAHNVVPNEITMCFDIRLPPNVNMPKFEEQLSAWCQEAGPGVTYEHFHGVSTVLTLIPSSLCSTDRDLVPVNS